FLALEVVEKTSLRHSGLGADVIDGSPGIPLPQHQGDRRPDEALSRLGRISTGFRGYWRHTNQLVCYSEKEGKEIFDGGHSFRIESVRLVPGDSLQQPADSLDFPRFAFDDRVVRWPRRERRDRRHQRGSRAP
ncbi:MAG: hypothetical protein UZ18_ATM001000009, partial [Armatimonadetes bacterium OLB18]